MTLRRLVPLIAMLGALAGCNGPRVAAPVTQPTPPAPQTVTVTTDGRLILSGEAQPLAHILLEGQDVAQADSQGAWQVSLAQTAAARSLSLATVLGQTRTQDPGPLVLLPDAAGGALLSPGGGARLLTPTTGATRILAIDYDAQGGLVVSGRSSAGADVLVRIDSMAFGRANSDADGQFSIVLTRPVSLATHVVEASGGAAQSQVKVDLSPPIHSSALVARRLAWGWRLDWITAAGGVQTTLLFDEAK